MRNQACYASRYRHDPHRHHRHRQEQDYVLAAGDLYDYDAVVDTSYLVWAFTTSMALMCAPS